MQKPIALTEDQLKDVEKRARVGYPYAIGSHTIHALIAMARERNEMVAKQGVALPFVGGL